VFRFGHLSDLHATPVAPRALSDLLGKRFFGWLSWQLRRRRAYRPEVLAALLEDLSAVAPDEVVVTGDLTNVALPGEFDAARTWLERIGRPERVFVIPGNHDAYVPIGPAASLDKWSPYTASDPDVPVAAGGYPSLRRRGPVAFVGVNSAHPTAPFLAKGTVGEAQRQRLEERLAALGEAGACRVVLIHHPICDGATSRRRSLTDAAEVRAVLRRAGAELVLHGHNHRTQHFEVAGPEGPIPVVCVRSSSYDGKNLAKRAQYHVYEVAEAAAPAGARFRITLRTRSFRPEEGRFVADGERVL
jgi:3',5'-cyclic AMP phosphodiesterase CpdA